MSIFNNILINLYGEEFRRDFEEHLALLREINEYYRRKRKRIEEDALKAFKDIIWWNNVNYENHEIYYNTYNEWFKEIFIADYDKAIKEIDINHREICLLRIAREAAYRKTNTDTIFRFFKAYDISNTERVIFWMEYYDKRR